MDKFSFLGTSEIETIEQLYKLFQKNPNLVDESWEKFFQGFEFAQAHYPIKPPVTVVSRATPQALSKEFNVINLIQAYRQRGHLFTKTNPVRTRRKYFPTLDIENFELSGDDLSTIFSAGSEIGIGPASLKSIIEHLQQTYCQSVGVEYLFMREPGTIKWLQKKMESSRNTPHFTPQQRKHIYHHLKLAVGFENFIHRKFMGQKRFSLEGAESIIPALDALVEKGALLGIKEVIIGMSHRGRLNVLANIMGKPYADIFKEFMGEEYEDHISLGDVKYHLGYVNSISTDQGSQIKLELAPNPSHLETVGALVQGITRSVIDHKYQGNNHQAVPIVIHGDAAIAGQGIVYETIQMSQLPGYETGGTIHLVINNQVGFTTNYLEGRSSTYCTDVGKVTRSPIFHVNGDDVEALIYTVQLAMEYRQEFHSDVFIDILSYRKYGHNEGDEPRFTQPLLYKEIAKHKNPRDIYANRLISDNIYTSSEIEILNHAFNQLLEDRFEESQTISKVTIQPFMEEEYQNISYATTDKLKQSPHTGVDIEMLKRLSQKITTLPSSPSFFKKIIKLMAQRQKMIQEDRLDWAMGELLAYASLLNEGFPVRLSGQDSERGTFSHRHAALVLEDSQDKYFPLTNISSSQAPCYIYNSPLNEYAVMGFEYGYALAQPQGLTIWEAQFGDFHNVAQPIIDQYLSAAEDKWGIRNGLTLLLPHGYEGQGAEHSSARIERFLTLCAKNNMQIVNPSSPANFFHVLRRQVKRDIRIPLICFTPKSLLRHPMCTSSLKDLSKGGFREVIDDNKADTTNVRRVVFCSGKIYYDLLKIQQELAAHDIALIRIEQLYPFPQQQINEILKKYTNALLHLWVQEEPENMGPWQFIHYHFKGAELAPIVRLSSGSPATGLSKIHQIEQDEILRKVFRKCTCERKLKYCGLQCMEGSSRQEILRQHQYFQEIKHE